MKATDPTPKWNPTYGLETTDSRGLTTTTLRPITVIRQVNLEAPESVREAALTDFDREVTEALHQLAEKSSSVHPVYQSVTLNGKLVLIAHVIP